MVLIPMGVGKNMHSYVDLFQLQRERRASTPLEFLPRMAKGRSFARRPDAGLSAIATDNAKKQVRDMLLQIALGIDSD